MRRRRTPCPRCGAETGEIIRENRYGYGCTSWKSKEEPGCGFVIWKKVAGRTLTPEIARQLIEEGRTRDFVAGFRSRNKRQFRARLVLTEEGKVEFEFPERPGALMNFLTRMGSDWNISLFHYRNHGADVGRVLVGLQVPRRSRGALRRFLRDLGYDYSDASRNPAYRFFLK